MAKAIQFDATGGPEVLAFREVTLRQPGQGEILVRHTAIGVNYIDIYHRMGVYPVPLPSGLGVEAVGVVEAKGEGVDGLEIGDRVAYAGGAPGAYAEQRVMSAAGVVRVPAGLDDKQVAALFLKGMTVRFLIRETYRIAPGDTVLLHAAAGGVGLIACQWLSALGATVIGTVSTEEKAALAKANGCTHTILYRQENVVERVRALTDKAGVNVVYDSVGKDTWDISLDCLRPRGLMVSYGNTTGPVAPVNIGQLAMKGSLFVTRPILATYIASRLELEAAAADVFAAIESGVIRGVAHQSFALEKAAEAHRALAGGQTTGSTILLPA